MFIRPLLLFLGSNDQEYMFLLKGHEDLRQDERVMQLFGLVNTLLGTNTETFKRHLGFVPLRIIMFNYAKLCFIMMVYYLISTKRVIGIVSSCTKFKKNTLQEMMFLDSLLPR